MSNQILIQADGLHKRYGNKDAVSKLDLKLHKGEILGLLGPNGAGKSTTLRMLSGCLAPTGGRVAINGIALDENPKAAKASIGYLPEHPPVYGELTVDEYLSFCAQLHGVPKAERATAIDRAKQSCGLQDVGKRIIGNLSKGYQQRTGLAQAIIHRPDVIILDEPTVGLDPIQIREIRKLITELGERHTVILSSHILSEIQATCSRVMIISQGNIVFDRDLAEMHADARPDMLLLSFSNPPALAEISALPGIGEVREIGGGRLRAQCTDDSDPRENLVRTAVDKGWGLQELARETKTLEEIFVELTSRDDATLNKQEAA
ncbi:MAG: ABC transporter ATP-binding protein [Salinisphaeraceae bacterium]|nr:ABC transporter ATP-binding protein [Salinisphaeraceae bacterium]